MNWWSWFWPWFHREPEFEYLERYVDAEIARSVDPRRDAAVAVALSGATVAWLAGLALWFVARSAVLAGLAALAGAAFALGWIMRFQSQTSEEERALSRARQDARKVLADLNLWKQRRRLKRQLGAGMGELLDLGARYWLQTRRALESEAWQNGLSAPSHWAAARERAGRAMDGAMARLLLMSRDADAGAGFLSPAFDPARDLVEQMRELAREAERLSDRLQIEHAALQTDSPTSDLRDALSELRHLEAAEQELEQRIGG